MTQGIKLNELNAKNQFYLAQAAICAASAETALLANVREQMRSAGAAWTDMAKLTSAQVASYRLQINEQLARQQIAEQVPNT